MKFVITFKKNIAKFADFLEGIASHPLFGGATAVVTILAGAMASFFTQDIKDNLTPFWQSSKLSFEASGFWFFIFLAGVFLGLGQWAQTRRMSRASTSLEGMVKRLQTLPADGYLPSYQACYRVAAVNAFAVTHHSNPPISQIEETIRIVIGAILETARDFDRNPDTAYFGNIMLWRERGEGIEASVPIHLSPFTEGDQRVAGLLELIPELSTTTRDDAAYEMDPNIKPIVLQVPSNQTPVYDGKMRLKYPLLPGAPLAFINKVFVSYANIAELYNWLDTKCGLDAHTVGNIRSYFHTGDGKHIRSFGSIPILFPTEDAQESDEYPVAILNLHSTEENILQDNGQTLFAPLLEPFLLLLSILILRRQEVLKIARQVE